VLTQRCLNVAKTSDKQPFAIDRSWPDCRHWRASCGKGSRGDWVLHGRKLLARKILHALILRAAGRASIESNAIKSAPAPTPIRIARSGSHSAVSICVTARDGSRRQVL
jgi:hypothetical protein